MNGWHVAAAAAKDGGNYSMITPLGGPFGFDT